jgi:hypothetical protein
MHIHERKLQKKKIKIIVCIKGIFYFLIIICRRNSKKEIITITNIPFSNFIF